MIGVVGAVHDTSLAAPASQLIYAPNVAVADSNQSLVSRTIALVVRGAGDPHTLIAPVQRAVADIDRSSASVRHRANERQRRAVDGTAQLRDDDHRRDRLASRSFSPQSGLYGVLAYLVSLRAREISIRLAMGALPSGVARLVTRQGAGLAAGGVALGVVIFVATSRFLQSMIVGVGRPEPLTIIAVGALLMAIAMGASWIPARRAARIDPARALSGE